MEARTLLGLSTLWLVLAFPALHGAATAATLSAETVRQQLEKKYPDKGEACSGLELRFTRGTKVVALHAPLLRRELPGTQFFLTELATGLYEYPRAETLVAASQKDGKVRIQVCLSPVFTDTPEEFLTQFRGLQAKTAEKRRLLGEAIARLFQKITYRGELRNGDFQQPGPSIELWHNGHFWREVLFDFDQEGVLRSVTLANPKEKVKD
jgi:hypothetical protein